MESNIIHHNNTTTVSSAKKYLLAPSFYCNYRWVKPLQGKKVIINKKKKGKNALRRLDTLGLFYRMLSVLIVEHCHVHAGTQVSRQLCGMTSL